MIGFSYLQHLKRTQAIAPVAYGGAGVTPFYYQYHRKAEDHRISATADSSIKKNGDWMGLDITHQGYQIILGPYFAGCIPPRLPYACRSTGQLPQIAQATHHGALGDIFFIQLELSSRVNLPIHIFYHLTRASYTIPLASSLASPRPTESGFRVRECGLVQPKCMHSSARVCHGKGKVGAWV